MPRERAPEKPAAEEEIKKLRDLTDKLREKHIEAVVKRAIEEGRIDPEKHQAMADRVETDIKRLTILRGADLWLEKGKNKRKMPQWLRKEIDELEVAGVSFSEAKKALRKRFSEEFESLMNHPGVLENIQRGGSATARAIEKMDERLNAIIEKSNLEK